MVAVPLAIPVTTPVTASIEPLVGAELAHAPPVTASDNVEVPLVSHTANVPVIVAGAAFIVAVWVAEQPTNV